MIAFFTWLESLSIREAVILYLLTCIVVCAIILAIDWWFASAETRAIKRRDKARKRLASLTFYSSPIERSRITRKELDPAHRTGQFRVPRSMVDMKGVTKL